MAPVPADDTVVSTGSLKAQPNTTYWTKANIISTIVFIIVSVLILACILFFFLYRRHENKKLSKRKSDTAGLLANEDKTSMFSRDRASSVTLYVDSDAAARNNRPSIETMSLVPLHITPAEEASDPIVVRDAASTGSGVSSMTRLSTGTQSTVMLSPVLRSAEELDMGLRTATAGGATAVAGGRPRSTSTASQRSRYYERTSLSVDMPEVPKIVHTSA
jgi:hypothetical protein